MNSPPPPPPWLKLRAPICLSGNGVRRPNKHGDTKTVKMGGLAGARNAVNPHYSSLETLPCFFKRIIRERKNKQESPRDGERIEKQWGKGKSRSSNNSQQPAISGRSWILQESCMASVMTVRHGAAWQNKNDSFLGHSVQKSSETSSEHRLLWDPSFPLSPYIWAHPPPPPAPVPESRQEGGGRGCFLSRLPSPLEPERGPEGIHVQVLSQVTPTLRVLALCLSLTAVSFTTAWLPHTVKWRFQQLPFDRDLIVVATWVSSASL